jgi:hypothetical protein
MATRPLTTGDIHATSNTERNDSANSVGVMQNWNRVSNMFEEIVSSRPLACEILLPGSRNFRLPSFRGLFNDVSGIETTLY